MEELETKFDAMMVTLEKITKQVEALENQSYILYLQLNAETKQLIEKGTLDKDLLTKDMDELNEQLYKIARETMEEIAPVEAAEVVAE